MKKLFLAFVMLFAISGTANAWVTSVSCNNGDPTFLKARSDGSNLVNVAVWHNGSYVGSFLAMFGYAYFEVPGLQDGDLIKYKQQIWGMGTTITNEFNCDLGSILVKLYQSSLYINYFIIFNLLILYNEKNT